MKKELTISIKVTVKAASLALLSEAIEHAKEIEEMDGVSIVIEEIATR
jgi:hypothetical protein